MSDIWKQFGSDYDSVNQNLGGAADWLRSAASKVKSTAQNVGQSIEDLPVNDYMMKHPVLGSIYSGMQGFANMATGGIQGAANQALDPTGTQGLQQVQAQHPIATGIGQGAGMAAGLAATPTAPVAEAGTAAAKILPTIGRNVLTAGAVAAPGTVAEGIQTGDWGQALGHGLENTAIGGALGAGAEKGAQALSPLLNKIQFKAMGGATKDVKQTINALAKSRGLNLTGSQAAQGEGIIQKAVDLGNQFGAWFQKGKQALWDHIAGGYNQIANVYDKAAPTIADALPQIAQQDDLNKVRQIFGGKAVDDELLNQAGQIEKMGWTDARLHTRDMMNAALQEKQPDLPIKMKGAVAEALHNYLGETAQNLVDSAHQAGNASIPNLHDLDAVYGAAKAIHGAEAREAISLPSTFAPGSDTASRVGLQNMLLHGAGGLEGGALAALTGFDPNDPSSYMKTLAGIAAGGLGGRMMNRGAGKLAELTTGLGARGMLGGLKMAQGAAPQIAQVGARLPQAIGQVTGADGALQPSLPQDTSGGMPQGPQAAIAPGAPGMETPLSRLATSGQVWPQQQPQQSMDENAMAAGRAINDREQELNTQQVKDAQQTTLSGFDDAIRKKVFRDWSTWQSPFKGDFDSFYAEVYNSTNGFDPKNENTAKVIGGSDFANYQRTYQAALEMQSLGKDLTRAVSYNPWGGRLQQALDPEGQAAYERLVNTLWTAMTGESKPPGGKDRNNIESRLRNLRNERLDENGAKSKLFEMMQKEYGLNFDLLHQYGLLS